MHKQTVQAEPFFICLVDEDQRTFFVTEPQIDDRAWIERAIKAREAGRHVILFRTPAQVPRAIQSAQYSRQTAYALVDVSPF